MSAICSPTKIHVTYGATIISLLFPPSWVRFNVVNIYVIHQQLGWIGNLMVG